MNQELLEHILKVSRHMAETQDLSQLLNYVVDEAIALVGAERGYIVLVQSDGSLDFRVKRSQEGQELQDAEDQISRSILKQVISTGQPLVLRDAKQDPLFGEAESVVILGLRSIMCVPLIARGETIGAIYVENRSIRGRFSDNDVIPLILFANQAAVAIENARLFQTLKEAHNELELRVEKRTIELSRTNALLKQEITERMQTEKELQKAQQSAEAASLAKSALLANMSHELRTPLNGILGYAQILKQDPTMSAQQQEGLNVIQKSGEHLLLLINDILDLAKVEAGKIELFPQPFNLPGTVSEVCDMMQSQAKAKNLACAKHIGPLPKTVWGDEKRLRQVLVNLLSNAVKFTEQGQVTLAVKMSPDGQERTRFQVTDTGIGIAPHHLETIFVPFEQVNPRIRQEKGTGLGLSISRELVALMGGALQVKSEVGQGSTFWFDIPLPEIADISLPATQPQHSIAGIKGQSPKILVVDDDAEGRQMVIDMLRPMGFVMAEARDGNEGLVQVAALKPDAVILDLVMPEMAGLELLQHIRQSAEFNHIPLIATSASSYGQDRRQSLAAGANAFVPKPVNLTFLLETLRQQLQLEWIYREQEPAPEPESPLVWPPPHILSKLIDLARIGDIAAVQQYADKLVESNPQLAPFSATLRHFTDNFQINQLQSFLESQQEA